MKRNIARVCLSEQEKLFWQTGLPNLCFYRFLWSDPTHTSAFFIADSFLLQFHNWHFSRTLWMSATANVEGDTKVATMLFSKNITCSWEIGRETIISIFSLSSIIVVTTRHKCPLAIGGDRFPLSPAQTFSVCGWPFAQQSWPTDFQPSLISAFAALLQRGNLSQMADLSCYWAFKCHLHRNWHNCVDRWAFIVTKHHWNVF